MRRPLAPDPSAPDSSTRRADVHQSSAARPRPALPIVLAMLCLLAGAPDRAFAEDGVAVLPTGGVTDAPVYDLDTTGPEPRVRDRGRRPLVEEATGPVPIRDFKILPDGRNLLTDVDGRGVAITGADAAIDYAFTAPLERPRVTSASVSAYAAPGEPTRLLVTDSNRSQVYVIDPATDEIAWIKSFAMPSARASFAQAVALPGGRTAIAVSWPSLAVSAIDIYESQAGVPGDPVRRLASAQHPDAPDEVVIVPELADIRDLMGLPDRHLLVTTRFKLLEIDLDGAIVWSVDIADSDKLHGEFASARLLPSGRVAVATFEPGVWTSPHTNHRIHWLSGAALDDERIEVEATSVALGFAPARLEVADGHGASGTFGYRPGLDASGAGTLADLQLGRDLSLDADTYRLGQTIWGSANVVNAGADTVVATRLAIILRPGACGSQTGTPITLEEASAVELAAGDNFELQGRYVVDEAMSPGRWCARVRAQDGAGDVVDLGTPVAFDVVEGAGDTGSSIEVSDLGYWSADAADAGGGGDAEAGVGPESGCACDHGAAGPPANFLVGIGLLLGIGVFRRRRA